MTIRKPKTTLDVDGVIAALNEIRAAIGLPVEQADENCINNRLEEACHAIGDIYARLEKLEDKRILAAKAAKAAAQSPTDGEGI